MNKNRSIYKAGFVSVLVNVVLFILKLWAGIVSGSIALTADAWHTLSDSLSSIIVMIGVRLSSKKPDKSHPFGHGRWEPIAAMVIGFLLAIIAYEFMKDSFIQLKAGESANFGALALFVTLLSIVLKEALAQYAFYISRKTGSVSMKADGWHHRTDALSSLVVLAGILLKNHFWWIDSILGFIVSLMLLYATYEILKDSVNKLLGEKPAPELIQNVETIIKSLFDEDLLPHHYHIHNYITHQELTFHIKLNNNMDILSGHTIATTIENKIFNELHIMATVHMEPRNYRHTFD